MKYVIECLLFVAAWTLLFTSMKAVGIESDALYAMTGALFMIGFYAIKEIIGWQK